MKRYSFLIIIILFVFVVFVLSGCAKKAVIQTDVVGNGQKQDNQTIDQLTKQNEEQQRQLDELKNQQEQQRLAEEQKKVQTESTSNIIKPKNCSADVVKYCPSDSFTDPNQFKKFLKVYEEDFSKSEYEKYKEKFTDQFNKCQVALKCE